MMPGEAASSHTVGFLLVPEFSMIAFTSSIEPLRLANRVSGEQLFAWKLYSPDGQPIAASNGVTVVVDGSYADVGPMPEIIVCAGLNVQKHDHSVLIAKLRRLAFYGVSIGAVCTGTHVLAQAGLLDGFRCTIHWENYDSFVEMFPTINVTQELFEFDRNRFSCAGGTAAIDMMLSLIAAKKGQDIAALVSDELIHHRIRSANERQRMELRARLGIANQKLLAVVSLMERHIETPLSCGQLARTVGLSARQLERLFKRYLGETPTHYYMGLRLQRAKQLLQQTSMPIFSAALACGFSSASHFSMCYGERFQKTPSEERRGGPTAGQPSSGARRRSRVTPPDRPGPSASEAEAVRPQT
jgi:AraC family transcriptional regulator, glycine betaine-responsive activator